MAPSVRVFFGVLVAITLAGSVGLALAGGPEVRVVSVAVPWNPTGLGLAPGQVFTIVAKGLASTEWNGSPENEVITWSGPEGRGGFQANAPVPGAPVQSLIAKIGPDGVPFFVGQGNTFTVGEGCAGELFLGYNDIDFADNFGYFVAFLSCPSCQDPDSYGLTPNCPAGVQVPPPDSSPSGISVRPNPNGGSTSILLGARGAAARRVEIVDGSGRRVRALDLPPAPESEIVWDGRDEAGREIASGVYFVRLEGLAGETISERITVVR